MGLTIDTVSHAYNGVDVVRGVTLRVEPGEVACLLGPSGCGKTTLLRLAAGLEPLGRGRIEISGRTVAEGARAYSLPPEARRVGLMFQDYALFPHLTVRDNVAFGIVPRRADRRAWIDAALTRAGLAEVADSYPHTLSGGQQQRCALLRALAPEPLVLLLDEPFSGLDVTRREQVREQTLSLLRDAGVATLIVTHDPEEAMFMADRLLIMKEGAIVQQGSPEEVYLRPATAFVAGLFGSINRLAGQVADGQVTTVLGTFAAEGMADGQRADVLVRPEGIVVGGPGEGLHATVVDARLLGRSSHVRLAMGDGCLLQAVVPGVFVPPRGAAVSVRTELGQVFVFAAE